MADETRKDAPRAPRPIFETSVVEESPAEKTAELFLVVDPEPEAAAEAAEPDDVAGLEAAEPVAPAVKIDVEPEPEADAEAPAQGEKPEDEPEAHADAAEEPVPAEPEATAEPAAASEEKPAPAPATGGGPIVWLRRTFPGNEHAVVGGVAGLICALLLFAIGIWRTIVIVVLMFAGVAIGQISDGDPKIIRAIGRIFSRKK